MQRRSAAAWLLRMRREAIADKDFLPKGGLVGVPCHHLYERDAELPKGDGSVTVSARDLHLKGADVLLYVAAARAGLRPSVVRLLSENCACERYVVPMLPSLADADAKVSPRPVLENCACERYVVPALPLLADAHAKVLPELVEDEFVASGINTQELEQSSITVDGQKLNGKAIGRMVHWALPLPDIGYERRRNGGKVVQPPLAKVLDEVYLSATGYFGNEASCVTVYAYCAIVFQVPPAKQRIDPSGGHGKGIEAQMAAPIAGLPDAAAHEDADVTAAFAGSRRGYVPGAEEAAAQRACDAYVRRYGFPLDVQKLRQLAGEFGMTTGGSAASLVQRIERAARESREMAWRGTEAELQLW
ncbi:hypothetical protein JKP88DRAFT_303130 [Tribonema minus]|uniref:Uncharacterized protein n=1 Tax=Tribonema minus TaxID=303371 RepID=A0A836CKU1_9STRA|nr:hypothetical protein JKP88DRAFT_303130 [Tribonema minus]